MSVCLHCFGENIPEVFCDLFILENDKDKSFY